MTQVIDTHMHLEVLFGKSAFWKQENSSIVDKNINLFNMPIHFLYKLIDCF